MVDSIYKYQIFIWNISILFFQIITDTLKLKYSRKKEKFLIAVNGALMKRLKHHLLVTQWSYQEGCAPQCILQLSLANCFARKSQGKKNLSLYRPNGLCYNSAVIVGTHQPALMNRCPWFVVCWPLGTAEHPQRSYNLLQGIKMLLLTLQKR